MSFYAAAWAINRRTKTATAKLVLIGLADCHNGDTGQCDPGNTYLARIAQCSRRTVIRAIEELVELGLISVTSRSNGRSNNYTLHTHKTGDTHVTSDNVTPVTSVHEPVTPVTPTGDICGSSFSIEPVRTNKQTNKGKGKPSPAPIDFELAEIVLAGIRRLKSDFKTPNIEKWADDCRKMRAIDGRHPERIKNVFSWANRDHFWQTNILSPAKLREKFDRLEMESQRGNVPPQQQTGSNRRTRDRSVIDMVTDTDW